MSSLDRLARRIADLERQVGSMSAPRLAHSSIVEGAIDEVILVDTGTLDEWGNAIYVEQVVARFGQQADGSHVAATFSGPQPPRPVAPIVTSGPGYLSVRWTGEFEDRVEPYRDHDHVAVHVADTSGFTPNAATLVATMRAPQGETVVVPVAAGRWYVSLVAVAASGRWSDPAPYSDGEPGESSGIDVTAREMAQAAETAAQAARDRAAEALAAAGTAQASADGKMVTYQATDPPTGLGAADKGDLWFETDQNPWKSWVWDGTTWQVAGDIAARTAAANAQHTAGTAQTLAASKTRTYYANTPPAGETVGDLWVNTSAGAGNRLSRSLGGGSWVVIQDSAAAQEAATRAESAAQAADRIAKEGRALADAVSAAANAAASSAIDAGRTATVTLTAADGTTRTTYSPDPPGGAPGRKGDTWYRVGPGGDVIGLWECTDGDVALTVPPAQAVTPPAPVFTPTEGGTRGAYTIPARLGVDYLIGRDVVGPGRHQDREGPVAVTARAQSGFTIPVGAQAAWVATIDPGTETPRVQVTPTPPVFNDRDGPDNDQVQLAAQAGVSWFLNGSPVQAGTLPASGTVTVAAAAAEGYEIPAGAVVEWTRVFDPLRYVTPTPPTFTDANGPGDTVTLTSQAGVSWRINGQARAAGTHAASGSVTVTAHAGTGYALTGTTTWSRTFDATTYVTPTPPVFNDGNDTFTIPTQAGVIWRRDGTVIQPGTYSVPVTSTIAATNFTGIANGQPWPSPWVRSWRHNTACIADVQNSQGRMLMAGTGSWQDKMTITLNADRAYFDITYKIRVESLNGESWHHFVFRTPQRTEEPKDGYDVFFQRGSWGIYRMNNWSSSVLATNAASGMALDTDYRIRVQVLGSEFKAKLWPAAAAEPAGWGIETSDTMWGNGRFGFHGVGPGSAAGATHRIDDITVTDPTASGGPVPVAITAEASPGYSLTGTKSWTYNFT